MEKKKDETKIRGQSWRTDWLLGRAFCRFKTPPPLHPSPHCEGHPDRQPRKPGLQTVTTLILPDKSLICLMRPSPLFFPPLNVKHTVELKDFFRVRQEDLSLATNKKINSYNLYHITDFQGQISNANLVQRCLRLTSSFKDGASQIKTSLDTVLLFLLLQHG